MLPDHSRSFFPRRCTHPISRRCVLILDDEDTCPKVSRPLVHVSVFRPRSSTPTTARVRPLLLQPCSLRFLTLLNTMKPNHRLTPALCRLLAAQACLMLIAPAMR